MKRRDIAFTAAALSVAWCGSAYGDDESEKALAQKFEELQKKFDELSKRVGDGSNKSEDELEKRVAELEKISKKDSDGLFPYWKSGTKLDSADGAFKLQMGGRIQSDWTWFSNTTDAEKALGTQIEAGEEFRRARLAMAGTIYNNVAFSAEYDFAGGTSTPKDVWIMLKKTFVGNIQVGNFKEPTGTEELTSDLFIPFLERSSANEAFAPDYKAGFQVSDTFLSDRASYQLAMTRNSAANGNSTGNSRSGDYNFTGRIAGQPWTSGDSDRPSYLTVGVAGSVRSPQNDTVQYSARPELHIAPKFVDTGAFAADRGELIEADAGFVTGPLWIFGDFFHQTASVVNASDVNFTGWQLALGWFLTGESKPYKASNSTYDRITPKHNYDGKGGAGAWELATRIDELDLNDGDIQGGKVQNFTFGVSWYVNPNTRVMVDWVHSKQNDLDVSINGLEMRFQIDF